MKLKIYMIGSFINRINKNNLNKMAILRIPYKDNIGAVKDAVWQGNLYFIIAFADIKIIK